MRMACPGDPPETHGTRPRENAELREEMRQLRGMLGAGHGAPVAEAVSALVRRNQMLKVRAASQPLAAEERHLLVSCEEPRALTPPFSPP